MDSDCEAAAPLSHGSQIVGGTTAAANDGSVDFRGTSWVTLAPPDWQQARALPGEGIEHLAPQQGTSIAAHACGILQPALTYSPITSAKTIVRPLVTIVNPNALFQSRQSGKTNLRRANQPNGLVQNDM